MRRLIFCLVLMVVACGPAQAHRTASPLAAVATPSATATASAIVSPSPTTRPSPSQSPSSKPSPLPQPSTSPSLLFAVLEAKIPGSPYVNNTVAIAGLDGYARAKTTFIPMPVPTVECAGPVLPPSAHVAGDRVYFADGTGVVRSLSTTGQIAKVASFPFTGHQQMLSFAVSPDGSQLLGAVLTLPAKPSSWCGTTELSGYGLDVYSAKAGGPSVLLYHQDQPAWHVMALIGWDNVGPLGTYPTAWASQGGGPAPHQGSTPVRVDANSGRVLGQVANPNICEVWDIAPSGDFICMESGAAIGSTAVSVRRPDGTVIWRFSVATSAYSLFLALDEQHVVLGTGYVTEVVGRDGRLVKLGSLVVGYQFGAAGWLDSSTLIGGLGDGQSVAAYVGLSAPGTAVSLGFSGTFVGAVHT